MVDDEGEGEVGGWEVVEPEGVHVQVDGAFVVGCREGGEYVGGCGGGEARGVDVVDLDGVFGAVFEEVGVPGYCRILVSGFRVGF